LITNIKDASEEAHDSLSRKISALEKWRWMMMGAGIVIGSLGFESISQLLK
jgi:signal transduction histidine kinase